jgi:adenylyltransferase/sulfurtransferase
VNDEQRQRYSRHLQLGPIGEAGQERLLGARALVIGVGGLGSPVALYLAAAGVGHLTLVDYDQVELSNLQRQIIHHTPDIGRLKVDSARDRLATLNPDVRVETVARVLEGEELLRAVAASDVVVDASDNFASRFALNTACVAARRPLVSGAAVRFEGQVTVFRADRPGGPCYRCLYPEGSELEETCGRIGVFAPLLGIVGGVQATEAVKVLLGAGDALAGRLLVIDALGMEVRTLTLRRDPACPVCGRPAPA